MEIIGDLDWEFLEEDVTKSLARKNENKRGYEDHNQYDEFQYPVVPENSFKFFSIENLKYLNISELDEQLNILKKIESKLNRKITYLGEDIEFEIRNFIRKGRNQLEDDVDSTCNKMRNIVETEWYLFTNFDSKIRPKLDEEISKLSTRTLKRSVEYLASNAKRAIDKTVDEFFTDTEEILMRYLPDFDSKSFIKKIKNKVEMKVTEKDLFSVSSNEEEEYGIFDWIDDFLKGASFGILKKTIKAFTYGDKKAKVLDLINSISSDFDPTPYLEAVISRKEEVISIVKNAFSDSLIKPLQEQLEEVKNNKSNIETRLQDGNSQSESCISDKKKLMN